MSENLAIHGGAKVKTTPYGKGCKHDAAAIAAALTKRLEGVEQLPLAMGPSIMDLRRRMGELYGVKHAVPTSSGTAAIHAGLAAMRIEPGDEVITTPSTDHGTAIGIMQLGAIPVFADVDRDTMMIEAHTVEPCITDKTRAILVVHFAGCPTDMDAMMKLADARGLMVLEDCAQSWLTEWRGKKAGTFGNVGIVSFNESKHLSTGEGGVILTDDDDIAAYADGFVDKSYNRSGGDWAPSMPAFNLRLSEINAVLALVQLDKVQWVIDRRHELGERLTRGIADLPGVSALHPPDHSKSSYWRGVIRYDPDVVGLPVETFTEALSAEGIPAGAANARCIISWPLFQTLNKDPNAFSTYRAPGLKPGMFELSRCPNAAKLLERSFQVHISEFCTDQDMQQTAEAITKVYHGLRAEASVA